jgi:pimeloyl-ACP methyl ester carboxylesterase
VQGAGAIGEGWRPQVEALADRFTTVTFDNRGIGQSTCAGALTIEDMARDALAIMDAEGIERFHLAGHSMGGLIAQQIALTAPHRVLSLALLCTFLRGRQASTLSWGMLATALRMRIGPKAARRRAFTELVMPAAYLRSVDGAQLASQLAGLFGHDLASQPSFVMTQLRAMARFDVSARLTALAPIPTLVVSAQHDRIARPEYGRALADAIPGARYVEIDEAGHAVTIQLAARINQLLVEHFTQPSAAPAGPA